MADHHPNLPSRRDRRIAARKIQIIEAAARLFSEKGFHRTTTRDIAEAADVSEGTLYNYFENKDDLLMGIMAHLVESQQVTAHLSDGIAGDARQFLEAMLRLRKEFISQNGTKLQSVLSEILVNPDLRQRYYAEYAVPSIQQLEGHLLQRTEAGQIRPLDAQLTARILIGLTTGLYVLEVLGDTLVQDQWEGLVGQVASIFFDGVAPGSRAPEQPE